MNSAVGLLGPCAETETAEETDIVDCDLIDIGCHQIQNLVNFTTDLPLGIWDTGGQSSSYVGA